MKIYLKLEPFYLFILLVSSLCISNSLHASQDIKSWEEVPVIELNRIIQKANESGEKWVYKPEFYIFNLFDLTALKKISYEFNVDNIEKPKNIEIRILRDGFLDDSVRGDIHQLKLKLNNKMIWKIVSIKKAISCWRNNQLIYSKETCP